MNIAQGLAHAKKAFGSHQAVACGNTRYTWNDFEQRTDALARGLAALGIVRGDRVAVLMLNCHRYLELYYACARMGAVIVPLNIRLARTEIVFILNDSETKVLVVDKPFAPYATGRDTFPSVEHIVYCGEETPPDMINYDDVMSKGTQMQEGVDQVMEDDDIAGLFYTGGTTGRAKGVMLSHKNIVSNAMNAIIAFSFNNQATWLHAAPMFHLADVGAIFGVTMLGARHAFIPMFNPVHLLQAIQDEKVTVTVLLTVLDMHDHIVEGTPEQVRRLASCGKEIVGVEVRVVNAADDDVEPGVIGEIIARGPNVMLGYWRMQEATSAAIVDGWMHTGDLAMVDEENYIYIVDRAKDMIISGGENIYSVEVENALYTHPAVLEAAVIGVPHETWGEAIHAVVVCKPGMNASAEELIAHARTQIAGYKVPRSIEFYPEALPKSGAGKILKRDLRTKYWADKGRNVN